MPSEIVQITASLIAILALSGFALWLRLGRTPGIAGESDAMRWAAEVDDRFEPVEIAAAHDGTAALLLGHDGQVMVLRQHGAHVVGRILPSGTKAELSGSTLTIRLPEKRFGTTVIELGPKAEAWVQRIVALSDPRDA